MKDLNEKIVEAWHRAEAQRHYEKYMMHKNIADSLSGNANSFIRTLEEAGQAMASTVEIEITIEQLNAALRKKRGRVAHVARRLKTIPGIIEELLKDPKSEFGVGERGFIYTKAELTEQAKKRDDPW